MDSLDFFFQAEDGIRDGHVTGVQTCALPISCAGSESSTAAITTTHRRKPTSSLQSTETCCRAAGRMSMAKPHGSRSEERRVGKECRSWGTPCHYREHSPVRRRGDGWREMVGT